MSVTPRRSMRTATVVGAALAVAGWCFASAAPASAGNIAVTASPNPASPGVMVTLTNTGVTEAGGGPSGAFAYFVFDYYEPNTNDCAPTASDARTRGTFIGQAGGYATGPGFPFSHQLSFTPEGGSSVYRVCAYLYSGEVADSGPPETVASTLLQVRRPAPAHHKKKHSKKHHKKH